MHFGTDGIRGQFNAHLFSAAKLFRLGYAIGSWLRNTTRAPRIIIISDTRASADYIKASLCSGLLLCNVDIIDCGILPTPAAYYLLQDYGSSCALIISASHNPSTDNGIKIITQSGKLPEAMEQEILTLFMADQQPNYLTCGRLKHQDAQALYIQHILKYFEKNFLKSIKIVLDTAHGACSQVAQEIFTQLGAHIIMLNNAPNGYNINASCGSLYPASLQQSVLHYNADIGFAFDGDGDRIIAISRTGALKNGDDILSLLSSHSHYQHQMQLVGTIMSNQALEHLLHYKKKKLIRTAIGDKQVLAALEQHNLLLGGEQSGHIILRDKNPIGDGILVALTLLEYMQETHNYDLITFDHFPQFLFNVSITHKKDLSQSPFIIHIQDAEREIAPGRLLVRYSGTEQLLRIMVEAQEKNKAHEIGMRLVKFFESHLQ